MPITKSPFKVYQNFLSPKMCSTILDNIRVSAHNRDKDGFPDKMERFHEESQEIIFEKFKVIIPEIEEYYGIKYKGTENIVFQCYPEGKPGAAENPHCESSQYLRKKWIKVHPRELTAVIWLKDFQDAPPIDVRNEVYGGKLEFPAYDFSLVPQRGTMVIYPAGPHFISAISPVLVGDLYQARLHIAADGQWLYQPENFRGTYREWFEEYA